MSLIERFNFVPVKVKWYIKFKFWRIKFWYKIWYDRLYKLQSGILILVASWPLTPKICWPSSNFSGQSKKLMVDIVQGPVFVGVLFSWIFKKCRYFDHDVTFTSVLAVTRKWNVAFVYLHLLYNMRSKQVNLRIIASQLWIF